MLDRLTGSPELDEYYKLPVMWRQVAVPTLMPLMVAYAGVLALFRVPPDWDRLVLALLCFMLIANVVWLTRALFGRVTGTAPFLTGLACVVAIWAWQWQAFNAFIPSGGLEYGYFLQPKGATAHLWILQVPFWSGTILIVLNCSWSIVSWRRRGLGVKALYAAPWWLGLFVIFSLPSGYLDAQGNASVFI